MTRIALPQLEVGTRNWANGSSAFAIASPGEGTFAFESVVVGVVVKDQPRHWTRLGDAKQRLLPLTAGNGWVLPGGIDGWCAWTEPQCFLNVSIGREVLRSSGLDISSNFRPVFGSVDPLVTQLATTLHAAPAAAPRLYRETLVHALAAQIAQTTFSASEIAAAPADPRLRRAADDIESHLESDVSLDVLAGVAAMSQFHFARKFKATFGLAPHAFLIRRRIARAQSLLKTTALPVAEIARRVGYEDTSRFSVQFKRALGVTPGQIRSA